MDKVLDCGPEVNEFEFQVRYCIYFWTYNLGKWMNLLIPHVIGKIQPLLFYKNGFGIQLPLKIYMPFNKERNKVS